MNASLETLACILATTTEYRLFLDKLQAFLNQEAVQISTVMDSFSHILTPHQHIVVAKSGVGKVDTAMTTQHVVDVFHPSQAINLGIAAALSPQVSLNTPYVIKETLQWDFDLSAVNIPKNSRKSLCPQAPQQLKSLPAMKLATGDSFIASSKKKDAIYTSTKCELLDMEGAAFARVCEINNIWYLILKIVTDHADEQSPKMVRENMELAMGCLFNAFSLLLR